MNQALVDQIVAAVLYEGYILYPYRASSKKNRQRFTFGRVYPEDFSRAENGAEPCAMQTECLVHGAAPVLETGVRFLQPLWREIMIDGAVVPEGEVDGQRLQTWQEATEREVRVPALSLADANGQTQLHPFTFEASETGGAGELPREGRASLPPTKTSRPSRTSHSPDEEASRCAEPSGGRQGGTPLLESGDSPPVPLSQPPPSNASPATVRRRQEAIAGHVEITAVALAEALWKITVRVVNTTPMQAPALSDPDAVLMRTFASTHAILHLRAGEFVSLLEPPAEFAEAAAACRQTGVWPVLVGDEAARERDTMLASPIILYDYPKIAPESAGDLFDGGEIDEILTLRIMTMTDAEKTEMRQVDDYARRILERTEALPAEQLLKMHGTVREVRPLDPDFFNPASKLAGATVAGVFLKPGDHVRIRPKRRADAMDIVLAGKDAVIEAVEQDVEGAIHFALVLADDPGRDLGFARMVGHRFFYTSDEVEPLEGGS
jgi:hypothetical protein